MRTGSIVDFYDDPHGTVLKSKLPQDQVPDFIKSAEYLTDATRDKLPDDVFALVMLDRGERMRKYACTDKGNTALSVIYFMQNRDRLPEEAQKVAAANLAMACGWYDLQPPLELLKVAGVLGAVLKNPGKALHTTMVGSDVAHRGAMGAERHNKLMGKVGDVTGSEIMPLSSSTEKTAGPLVAVNSPTASAGFKAGRVAKGLGAAAGVAGIGYGAYRLGKKIFGNKEQPKTAGFVGDVRESWQAAGREMPAGLKGRLSTSGDMITGKGFGHGLTPGNRLGGAARALAKPLGVAAGGAALGYGAYRLGKKIFGNKEQPKTASLQPYVDVTGQQPPEKTKTASAQRHCMVKEGQARFPIDSYVQVQQAVTYFEKHAESMHPADRRMYCTNLTRRADEVGINVPYNIRKYGSAGYAPDGEVKVAVHIRMQHWAEDAPERDMLKSLMEKAGSVHPDVFCEALRQFDETTGMNHLWDDGIYDPYYSTYGFVKQAEWVWQSGNDRLTEDQLNLSAKKDFDSVKRAFGGELAQEFRKNPQQIFDSLPLDSKRIIARMANDPQ